ncbi:hypothetical protein MRB53_018770 [Persea americana]|uniref:Uncharacterized protein n=1 Tax=Persea americana TaxID=3435 RepID=A0ACC2M8X8_PERAE|nr:hypothetical protein MRB53_018770 [Persea americana]
MTELEESRRKLVNLKMQKDGVADVHISVLSAVNGVSSPDKSADRTMGFRELKESVEEAKVYLQGNEGLTEYRAEKVSLRAD